MQENTVVQETTSANQGQISGQNVVRVVEKTETAETKRMKEHFNFFGPVTFLYAVFYAFCMFHNGSGITFPFFLAGTLLYFVFSLSKLEITLKKGSAFYMISILLLGISTFCTDGWAIISLNKLAVFLLVMCLLLNQYFDTKKWNLGKYVGSICQLVVMSFGELGKPFSDGKAYFREKGKVNKKVWYGLLGVVIALPIVLIAAGLLSSADAVFRKMTTDFMNWIRPGNIFNAVIRVTFLFFTSYALTSYLCKRSIPEEVKDRRKGEPVLAITIMSLLSLLYLLFSGIQIFGLFLGKMQLPEGYTYAQYAREGFFQLLAVSILNLILVLMCLSFFRESRILKVIMTIMSLCTFIMIASSVMRMIIYIRYYYLTFLRIFVLWMLAVLFVMFIGVLINIYRESFPLFRYGVVMVTVLYLALSFSHPDYIIARVNIANAPGADGTGWEESVAQDYGDDFFAGPFFRGSEYNDYSYLSDLSADAAPVIIPYMESLGYDFGAYELENPTDIMSEDTQAQWWGSYQPKGFGYYYLNHNKKRLDQTSLRTFNISRYMARKQIEARIDGK